MDYAPAYRVNRTSIRGRDEETGEVLYWQVGDIVPPETFGSGNALRANLHAGFISPHWGDIPAAAAEDPAPPPRKSRP